MRAAYSRQVVSLPPPLGIVALRAGKCVATGDDGKRYCDDPRPTRRGLADPEKSVVTKAKIRHFVTHQPMLLVPIEAPAAVSAVIPSALSALLRENVGRVSIKASYEDKTTARDNGLAASGRCSSAILVSPAFGHKKRPDCCNSRALRSSGYGNEHQYHITIYADSQADWTAQGRRSAMSEAIDVITEETEVSTTELATVLDVSVRQTIGDMKI